MKKGVNWIENQSENCYKMFKNCYIMHLGEQLDQLWVQVSLELNEIETTRFFSAERGVSKTKVNHKKGTQLDQKSQKGELSPQKFHTMHKYGSTHPTVTSYL